MFPAQSSNFGFRDNYHWYLKHSSHFGRQSPTASSTRLEPELAEETAAEENPTSIACFTWDPEAAHRMHYGINAVIEDDSYVSEGLGCFEWSFDTVRSHGPQTIIPVADGGKSHVLGLGHSPLPILLGSLEQIPSL